MLLLSMWLLLLLLQLMLYRLLLDKDNVDEADEDGEVDDDDDDEVDAGVGFLRRLCADGTRLIVDVFNLLAVVIVVDPDVVDTEANVTAVCNR